MPSYNSPRTIEGLVGGDWSTPEAIIGFVTFSFRNLYSVVANRNAIRARFNELYVTPNFSNSERFPEDQVYITLWDSGWQTLITQVESSLAYKDKSKDAASKTGTRDRGEDRESGYGDSMVAFAQGLASMMRKLREGSGIIDRAKFENYYNMRWDASGFRHIHPTDKKHYTAHGPAFRAYTGLFTPLISRSALQDRLKKLRLLNPNLGVDKSQADEFFNLLLTPASPDKGITKRPPRTISDDDDTIRVYIDPLFADWPNKLAQLYMSLCVLVKDKDTKFTEGQEINIARLIADVNDSVLSYYKVIDRMKAEIQTWDGVVDRDDWEADWGLKWKEPKAPTATTTTATSHKS